MNGHTKYPKDATISIVRLCVKVEVLSYITTTCLPPLYSPRSTLLLAMIFPHRPPIIRSWRPTSSAHLSDRQLIHLAMIVLLSTPDPPLVFSLSVGSAGLTPWPSGGPRRLDGRSTSQAKQQVRDSLRESLVNVHSELRSKCGKNLKLCKGEANTKHFIKQT